MIANLLKEGRNSCSPLQEPPENLLEDYRPIDEQTGVVQRSSECPFVNGSSHLRQLEPPEKQKLSSKIRHRLRKSANSKTFKVLMIVAALLNVLQLVAFFLISFLYLPQRTKKSIKNEDIYFMIDHIADIYVNYNYFAGESVL